MSSFDLKLLRNLDLFQGTPDTDTTVPVVLGNNQTVRVAWPSFLEGQVTLEANAPTTPTSPGQEGTISLAQDGIYAYVNGQWRKAPVYTENWNELTTSVRALLVDTEQILTAKERQTALDNLQVTTATTSTPGFVKLVDPTSAAEVSAVETNQGAAVELTEQGGMYVQGADPQGTHPGVVALGSRANKSGVATVALVEDMLADASTQYVLQPAKNGTLGGVCTSNGTIGLSINPDNGVLTALPASAAVEGVVRLAPSVAENDYGVVTSSLLYQTLLDDKESVQDASYTSRGLVQGSEQGVWDSTYIAAGRRGPVRLEQGILDVYAATATDPGVAIVYTDQLADDSPTQLGDYPVVPRTDAVIKFVKQQIQGIALILPPATVNTRGVVQIKQGGYIDITEQGIVSVVEANATTGAKGVAAIASPVYLLTNIIGQDKAQTQNMAANAYWTASYIASLQSQIDALTARIDALEAPQQT